MLTISVLQDNIGFTCTCAPGYTGTLCDDVIDVCLTSSCLNGATCVRHTADFTSYYCTCANGQWRTQSRILYYNRFYDLLKQMQVLWVHYYIMYVTILFQL